MELRFAHSALDDLQAIRQYYAQQGVPHIGDEFVSAILQHAEMLTTHPDAGRVVPEFDVDTIRALFRGALSERQLELPENEL